MAVSPMQRLRTNVTLAYRGILRADLAFEPVNAQEPLTKSRPRRHTSITRAEKRAEPVDTSDKWPPAHSFPHECNADSSIRRIDLLFSSFQTMRGGRRS